MIEAQLPSFLQANIEHRKLNDVANKAALKGQTPKDEATIRELAKDLESVFLSKMLEPMFPEGELFGGGNGSDIYRHLMIDEYGKALSDSGGIGLADQLVKDMLKLQEVK